MTDVQVHWQEQAEERSQSLARSFEHQRLMEERRLLARRMKPNSRCPVCKARMSELIKRLLEFETNRTV